MGGHVGRKQHALSMSGRAAKHVGEGALGARLGPRGSPAIVVVGHGLNQKPLLGFVVFHLLRGCFELSLEVLLDAAGDEPVHELLLLLTTALAEQPLIVAEVLSLQAVVAGCFFVTVVRREQPSSVGLVPCSVQDPRLLRFRHAGVAGLLGGRRHPYLLLGGVRRGGVD